MAYTRLNLQDGQVLTADHVKHIEDGIVNAGDGGGAGYTPVRGKDYWTDDDIDEIKSYVDDAILGGVW